MKAKYIESYAEVVVVLLLLGYPQDYVGLFSAIRTVSRCTPMSLKPDMTTMAMG